MNINWIAGIYGNTAVPYKIGVKEINYYTFD